LSRKAGIVLIGVLLLPTVVVSVLGIGRERERRRMFEMLNVQLERDAAAATHRATP
jgi:hypothetical protein